jgi:hypothetical protein
MKTFQIELQRIKSMHDAHGLVHTRVDATVATVQQRGDDDVAPTTTLTMTVENARTLFLLLKKQLTEVDSRKARSQR